MASKWTNKITEKQLYLIIILSVGALIIVNQFIAQRLLDKVEAEEYATFITGKVATESQKLETLSFRAVIDPDYFEELKTETEVWYELTMQMEDKDTLLSLSEADTERVQFYLDDLHEQRDELYGLINSVENTDQLKSQLNDIAKIEDEYSFTAGELYEYLEKVSEAEISNLRNVEIIIALISLLFLFLEFVFVIRPVIDELKRRKEKLEELNKSKDRILATVAHDIRNPIAGIEGILGILAEQIEELNPEDEELIELALESCVKAQTLIDELLDISLIESEEYHLETEVIHLEQYLKGVLSQFKQKADEKEIELRLKIDPESLSAEVDKNKFGRVIENIVSNSIKFTEEGKVELYSKEEAGDVIIEIRDTGIGIPNKLKDYIFDKFSRARRLGTQGEKTTGLGMSIVKAIVEKHGGKIWLESQEGKGTVFFITLPKKQIGK
jgi:signal transduction histidine kinase